MILSHVFLTQFRNVTEAEIDFADGVNVLWGDNAQENRTFWRLCTTAPGVAPSEELPKSR